jgi:tRNA threonylcarbamoyladenosine biosynthesis protein TsaE
VFICGSRILPRPIAAADSNFEGSVDSRPLRSVAPSGPALLCATPPAVQIGIMPAPIIVSLPDLAATEALAERLASIARQGDCILLEGPLGAGKTALARAFLRGAADDPRMEVPSPSFTLVQIYETRIGPVFHYDLWRLDGSDSLTELDWEDALDGIVLVEWPDRLGSLRPANALTITLRLLEGEAREATLEGWDDRVEPLAAPARVASSRPGDDVSMQPTAPSLREAPPE